MGICHRRLAFVAALALLSTPLPAAASPYGLSPSPGALSLAAARPGESSSRAEAEALLEAGLYFSLGRIGAEASRPEPRSEARLASAREAGLAALKTTEALALDEPEPYERARRVLALVHALVGRYDAVEYRLDAALLEGRYNCVSSASLFVILGTAAGLTVSGRVQSDHVYCAVRTDRGLVLVETTDARGYDVGGAARPGAFREARARGVVALAASNRAALLERSGLWAEALAVAVDAYAFEPGEASLETLAGRVSNSVAALAKAARYAEARALAEAAREAYGEGWGLEALVQAARQAERTNALASARPAEALALAEEALALGEADAAWLERAFSFAYSALSDERRAAGDHLGAWRLAVAATERFPSYPRLAMLERLARANWARAAYNEFVALYNAKRYAEALETVRAALALAPKEALLLEAESLVLKSLR